VKKDADATSKPPGESPAPRSTPAPPPRRGLPGWIAPVALLLVVGIAVWWFVFRESKEERGQRLIDQARKAMQAQDFATAEANLKSAIELAPQNGVLLHNLGVLYLKQNRLAEARSALERAVVSYGPDASEVQAEDLFQLASISFTEKKFQQAAAELERAIAAHPTRAQLHARLFDLQLGRLEDATAAENTLARWLRICGRTPRNIEDAAFIYYQHQHFDDAALLAGQAAALQDSFVEAHAMRARALGRGGRGREGLESLRGPLQRYPQSPELWVAQSIVLVDLGAGREGLAAADRAVALAPKDFEAHQARQKALSATGQLEEALKEIEVARELTTDPGYQRMLLRRQRLLRATLGQAQGGTAADAAIDSLEASE